MTAFRHKFGTALFSVILLALAAMPTPARADQIIFDDALENGWTSYGWATLNFANTSPTHTGADSISVYATNYGALYLHHTAFTTAAYSNLTFWVYGASPAQLSLKVQATVNGTAQPEIDLPLLNSGTWQQVTLSMSALGVAGGTMDGFWIQQLSTSPYQFYVDDISLTALPVVIPTNVNLSLNATSIVRTVDARHFAVNTAVWDSYFDTPQTLTLLTNLGVQVMRFPGGSTSDDYHWASNTEGTNTWTWGTSFQNFAHIATNLHAQAIITVNYGTGTASEAAAWVANSNVTNHYGFKYWEVGNENYGTWETDSNAVPNDPWTYANRAQAYIAAMKAVDPTIKIGVVAVTGEDSSVNNMNHAVTNPVTLAVHYGWTPVMLATLRSLGATPDYVIYHRYAQGPGGEDDASLLQSSSTWPNDAADLRAQVNDYLGAAGTNVELLCTENNSVYSNPGKQTTSLVNGLFLADSLGQLLQTEFNSLVWWDLRNGQDASNNNGSYLYGWRQYGDYGITDSTTNAYPTYYIGRLYKNFIRPGDKIVRATSDYSLVAAYAALRTNGSAALLVINKSPTNSFTGNITVAGYTPNTNAAVYSYGIPQDNAAQSGIGSPDVAQTNFSGASASFTYSLAPYSATVIVLPPAPPRLTLASVATDGNFRFQLNGQPGATYLVQSSSNLVNWIPVSTNSLISNSLTWTAPQPVAAGQKFYRAAWLP
jgi:alpha-N-arabinofuranosidase